MQTEQPVYGAHPHRPSHSDTPTPAQVMRTTLLNRISWGAVFAGMVIAFAVQLVLNLLGLGIGFATVNSLTGTGTSADEISIAGMLWWIFAGIVASFAGGFAAGRLAGEPKVSTSAWHGLVSWAASVLLIAFLMATAAGATAAVSGPFQIVMDQKTAFVSPHQDAQETASTAVEPTIAAPADQAPAADTPSIDSDAVATAALASAIALILGALAAWFGGRAGTVSTILREEDGVIHSGR